MSASGVDKAKRKRRLGLLRIRGRQNPQTQSPQTRTMGRGEKRVLAGDGGYGSRGVDRRRRRIPGREAISRGQGAKRGEKESVLQVLDAVAGREPPLTPAAGSKPPAA